MAQNVHPLRVCGHDAVLDPIVDHLDEMTSATLPAMQVAEFGSPTDLLASGCKGDVARARRQRLEDRIEVPHGCLRSADHHAVAALQAPDAAAGSDIDIV